MSSPAPVGLACQPPSPSSSSMNSWASSLDPKTASTNSSPGWLAVNISARPVPCLTISQYGGLDMRRGSCAVTLMCFCISPSFGQKCWHKSRCFTPDGDRDSACSSQVLDTLPQHVARLDKHAIRCMRRFSVPKVSGEAIERRSWTLRPSRPEAKPVEATCWSGSWAIEKSGLWSLQA